MRLASLQAGRNHLGRVSYQFHATRFVQRWNKDTESHMRLMCAEHARMMRGRLRTCAAYEFRCACFSAETCPQSARRIGASRRDWERLWRPGYTLGTTCVHSSSAMAGFPEKTEQHGPESDSAEMRPVSTEWLSDERIAKARRVWSKAYGRVISQDEAVEIVMNVRRLAEVLFSAEENNES